MHNLTSVSLCTIVEEHTNSFMHYNFTEQRRTKGTMKQPTVDLQRGKAGVERRGEVTGLYIKEIDSLSTPYFSKTFAYIA